MKWSSGCLFRLLGVRTVSRFFPARSVDARKTLSLHRPRRPPKVVLLPPLRVPVSFGHVMTEETTSRLHLAIQSLSPVSAGLFLLKSCKWRPDPPSPR